MARERNPLRVLSRLLRYGSVEVVPRGITRAHLRLALRNTLISSLLLLCIWVPVIFLQVLRSQQSAANSFTVNAAHQATGLGRTLIHASLQLRQTAAELEELAPSGADYGVVHDLARGMLHRLLEQYGPACNGYVVLRDGVFEGSTRDSFPTTGTFPDGSAFDLLKFPRWQEAAESAVPAIVGPLKTAAGRNRLLLPASFRWHQQTEPILLLVEFDIDQLLKENSLLPPGNEIAQEICTVDGQHLFGIRGLVGEYPVFVEFGVPGKTWVLLTVPRDGWFSLFPPEIFFFTTLGLVMLGGSGFSVWRVTLSRCLLVSELEQKSAALNTANLQMQEDLEKIQTAQRLLAASELRTRLIYEHMPVGVCLLEADTGRVLSVNPQGCRILSLSEAELQQRQLRDLLLLGDFDGGAADNPGAQIQSGEYFARSGDAGLCRVQLSLAPVVRRDGESERQLAVLQDVTARWQAQQELREHEERMRVLADTLPGPLLFVDAEERCRFANQATVALLRMVNDSPDISPLGLRSEEIVPAPIYSFLKPFIARALMGEETHFETTAEIEQLGHGAWMFFHRPLRREGRIAGFFAFLVDISQQRRNESQRRELAARMAEAHRMETVGTLAGGVAHEFNNMLQVVLGFADVLLVHCEKDEFAAENLNHIRHASRRASDLTKQLLAFARFQPGTPLRLNLADLVPASLKLLRHAAGDEAQIRWTCEERLRDVLLDASHLDLILANLLLNASHAMNGKGVIDVRARNLPAGSPPEPGLEAASKDSVVLSIRDTGCGMTPEVQSRMFDPFFTTRAVGQGTGLGLSTVYGLVVQAGGEITVRSAPGKGTSIHLLFPACCSGVVNTPPQSLAFRFLSGSSP